MQRPMRSVSPFRSMPRCSRNQKREDRQSLAGLNGQKGDDMKSRIVMFVTAMTVLRVLSAPVPLAAQSNYSVVELGKLGGTAGSANGINDRGWVTGADNMPGDLTSMASIWVNGSTVPLGTHGGLNAT